MAQSYFKKIYSHGEFYRALVTAARSAGHLASARRGKLLSAEFVERIMLAVTEVNGCEVCSWAHTKIALEKGLSAQEIGDLLSGDTGSVPEGEAVAVLFAQHFADQRGKPSPEAWQRLVGEYGKEKALGILAAARIMQAANIYGIAYSAFMRRLKGKPVPKSSLLYELTMMLAILAYLPASLLHALLTMKSDPLTQTA